MSSDVIKAAVAKQVTVTKKGETISLTDYVDPRWELSSSPGGSDLHLYEIDWVSLPRELREQLIPTNIFNTPSLLDCKAAQCVYAFSQSKPNKSQVVYHIPHYSTEIEPALRKMKLTVQAGQKLWGKGAAQEFLIVNAEKPSEPEAKMFTVEKDQGGFLDVLTPNGDQPETFFIRDVHYQREMGGNQTILQVAGAMSCVGSLCSYDRPDRNWEPDGFHLNNGKSFGWSKPNEKYGGVVIVGREGPAIYPRDHIPLTKSGYKPKEEVRGEIIFRAPTTYTAIEEVAGQIPKQLERADLFQTMTLVVDGKLDIAPERSPENPQGSSSTKATRRILVQRVYKDRKGHLQEGWVIIQIDKPVSLYETAILGKSLGARNVALLNTGSHALGWVKKEDGTTEFLLTPHPDEPTMPNFTSILVIVGPKATSP